jgi:hypothetical protein
MKVSVVRGGGLAGLVTTTSADTDTLAPEDARALRDKVERAHLLSGPEHAGTPGGGPDRFTFRVTVEDAGRTHTVRLREEDLTEDVSALIAWVRAVPGHTERVAPPGRSPDP